MIPLITSRTLLAGLFVFALAGTAHAQMDAGFIGQRYAGVSLFTEDIRSQNLSNGNGAEFNANLPLTSFLDVNLRASNEKFKDYSISDRRLVGSVIGYADLETWKPFLELSVANTAQSSTFGGTTYKNNENYWAVGLGIEAPVTKSTAIFGLATRNNYFDRKIDPYWVYKIGVNTWFSKNIGGVFSISIFEGESVTYSIGVTCRF